MNVVKVQNTSVSHKRLLMFALSSNHLRYQTVKQKFHWNITMVVHSIQIELLYLILTINLELYTFSRPKSSDIIIIS